MKTKEELKKYHAEWRAKNKEKWAKYGKKWYDENREKRQKSIKKWATENPEKRAEITRKWYLENRSKKANEQWERLLRYKTQVMEAYGGKCSCCGEKDITFLTVEHLNRNGDEHRKVVGNFYKWLIQNNFPKEGLSILCMNCNWAERHGRKCPHKVVSLENSCDRSSSQ